MTKEERWALLKSLTDGDETRYERFVEQITKAVPAMVKGTEEEVADHIRQAAVILTGGKRLTAEQGKAVISFIEDMFELSEAVG